MTPLPDEQRKLLLDENLAARVIATLGDLYPGSAHVSDAGLLGASDAAIWRYARESGFAVVTKDADFHRLSILNGAPPKVIWVRLGNCSTADIIQLLRARRDTIDAFLAHEEAAFLALA